MIPQSRRDEDQYRKGLHQVHPYQKHCYLWPSADTMLEESKIFNVFLAGVWGGFRLLYLDLGLIFSSSDSD